MIPVLLWVLVQLGLTLAWVMAVGLVAACMAVAVVAGPQR